MNLAGLTAHRIGGRDLWEQLLSEVLGRQTTGDSDGEHTTGADSARTDTQRASVRYARAGRALHID
jgi:hypothetical protein